VLLLFWFVVAAVWLSGFAKAQNRGREKTRHVSAISKEQELVAVEATEKKRNRLLALLSEESFVYCSNSSRVPRLSRRRKDGLQQALAV
jgi:hypothetical protein